MLKHDFNILLKPYNNFMLILLSYLNMNYRAILAGWIVDALESMHGWQGTIVDVCEHVWKNHRNELKGDIFYTWQYKIRWAAHDLRKQGIMKRYSPRNRGVWELA